MASPTKKLTPAQRDKIVQRLEEKVPTAAPGLDQSDNPPATDFQPLEIPTIQSPITEDQSRLVFPGDYLG